MVTTPLGEPVTTAPAASDVDRRTATVMFVDILGATTLSARAGIERAYAVMTGCLRVLDGIARRHGGVVDKYLSDCLMAVFGLPIESAEAPVAAVAAAVEMLDAAERYTRDVASPIPLTLRVGINTGPMIAGDLRGRVVREFAVMGDVVNVAARLKDVGAPGEVHIGPDTWAAARDGFAFATLEPLVLRGKAQRVPAFRLIPPAPGRRRAAGGAPPLVETPLLGRARELTALVDALAAVQDGTGRTVVLTGEEGSGKSRLVMELCRRAAADGVAVLSATAARTERDAPPRLVADLVSGGSSGTDEAASEPPLEAAVAALAARGPVIVACEDLQWADRASIALITQVAHATAARPVLWLLTARPDGDVARALGDGALTITLAPLPAADASALVDLVMGGTALSPVARNRIETRAAGNPYRLVLGALLAGAIETELVQEAETVERTSEAERRRVTVMFADITGFTGMSEQLPPADAYRAVGGCLEILHEVAVKHGGSVDKYLGDCILAMFGAPIAVEDAPRAAVNAAIEMRRRVREYNRTAALPSPLDIHVGITTGLGVAGDISGPLLREFTLMGDAVSIASKLKDVAPAGQIWVGPETHRATRTLFEWDAVPSTADGPPPGGEAWAVRSEREQVYRSRLGRGETIFAELVGRDAELAALRAKLADVARGHGGVAMVVGEAGLGKSRLFTELAASPEARAVRWVEGRSVAMGRTLRFHPFVDLLRSLLGLADDTSPDAYGALEAALRPLLGAEHDELAPYLAMLLGMPLPPAVSERIAGVRADFIDRLQHNAVRELIQAAARERPLALFFEDVYWADRSSIELLSALMRVAAGAPILFLFACRPGFPETAGRLREVAHATHGEDVLLAIELRPLDADGTRKLLATLFPHGALPRGSRELIAERTGGNPLYVEELLRSLIEQGAVEVIGNGLRATATIDTIRVPATVQDVILNRVDRLRPRPKQTLQLAAVVGQRVAEPVLAALVPEQASLPDALDELVDAQLLLRETRRGVPHYVFKHRLIQDVTYESILEMRRAELHRAVGQTIERHLEGVPGYHGMLAYHYSMGNDPARAEEELFLAGDDAARAGAPTEALDLLQEASRLYLARHPGGGDPAKRVALHRRLAGAHLHRGHMEDACRHYDEALSLLGEVVPASRLAVGRDLATTVALVALDLYLRDGGSARRPPATPRDLDVIELMFDRARAQTTADPVRFLLNGLATLRKLRRIDPATVPGAGGMYAGTVGLFSFGGISFDVARRFLAVAERYVDPAKPEAFFWRVMSFTHHFVSGDWDARHEIPAALVDDALRRGQLWDVATHVGLESFKQLAQGRWADCTAHIDRLERIEEAYAYDLARSNRHAALAFLNTERRILDAAEAAANVYLESNDEVLLNLLALGTKGKVQVLRGDVDGARATLATADGLLARQRVPPWYVGVVTRSHLLLRIAERELGIVAAPRLDRPPRRLRREARAAAARFAWLRPEVWQAIAQLDWLAGRRRAALHGFGRALDEADRLRLRPDAARVRIEIARRLLEAGGGTTFRGQDAPALVAAARRELEALDLSWDLARLELALSRVQGRPLAAALR